MEIIRWEIINTGKDALDTPVVLSIGVFDALHIGHQKLIKAVVHNSFHALSVILTFIQSPDVVLSSIPNKGTVLSYNQKIVKLESLDIALVVLIDFSYEFSKLTGEEFIQQIISRLDIKKLVVGYNFYFGRGRDTDVIQLKNMLEGSAIQVEVIQPSLYLDEVISSSRIREAIIQGRFDEVKDMLAAEYRLDLSSVTELAHGGGWASIRRQYITQVLPQEGHYNVLFNTEEGEFPGEMMITTEDIRWKVTDRYTVTEILFIEKRDK